MCVSDACITRFFFIIKKKNQKALHVSIFQIVRESTVGALLHDLHWNSAN